MSLYIIHWVIAGISDLVDTFKTLADVIGGPFKHKHVVAERCSFGRAAIQILDILPLCGAVLPAL